MKERVGDGKLVIMSMTESVSTFGTTVQHRKEK